MTTSASLTLLAGGLGVLCAYLLYIGVYNRFFHPLRRFPGPYLASIIPLWYFRILRNARVKELHKLHAKYGDFVRVAPNYLALRNPDPIETVLGPKGGSLWKKGEFYEGFTPHIPGARTDGFSQRDPTKALERRRVIASLYSQRSILQYEPRVDRLIDLFYRRMETFADTGDATDMAVWLKRYTFDVIGEIFFGRREGFGMVRDGVDYNNWCHLMDVMPSIAGSIACLPRWSWNLYFVSQLLDKGARDGVKGMADVIRQAQETADERWREMQAGDDPHESDMLTHLLEIVRESGEKLNWTVPDVQTEIWNVIWAGADTTATALTSVFYHLHRHPDRLQILRDEIEGAFRDGRLSHPVRFGAARKLPYLHAVVTESMRVHPSLGFGLPRVVPPGGATICGEPLPGGVEVIISAAAVHFDRRAFGEDADDWIPERWIRSDADMLYKMEKAMLQFGAGPRMCIGKHISQTEMYKLLPTILMDFDFELLVDEWKIYGGIFHKPGNVLCQVRRRRREATTPLFVNG